MPAAKSLKNLERKSYFDSHSRQGRKRVATFQPRSRELWNLNDLQMGRRGQLVTRIASDRWPLLAPQVPDVQRLHKLYHLGLVQLLVRGQQVERAHVWAARLEKRLKGRFIAASTPVGV